MPYLKILEFDFCFILVCSCFVVHSHSAFRKRDRTTRMISINNGTHRNNIRLFFVFVPRSGRATYTVVPSFCQQYHFRWYQYVWEESSTHMQTYVLSLWGYKYTICATSVGVAQEKSISNFRVLWRLQQLKYKQTSTCCDLY